MMMSGNCDFCENSGDTGDYCLCTWFGWKVCRQEACLKAWEANRAHFVKMYCSEICAKFPELKVPRSDGSVSQGWIAISDAFRKSLNEPFMVKVGDRTGMITKLVPLDDLMKMNC